MKRRYSVCMTVLSGIFFCFLPLAVWAFFGILLRWFSAPFALRGALYGCAAVLAAAVLQLFLEPLAFRLTGPGLLLFSCFVKAALVEETVKLLMVYLHSRIRFEAVSPRTFLFSAALVGLSFASFENIVYLLNNPFIVTLRFVTAVPLHLAATVLAAAALFTRHERSSAPLRTVFAFLAVIGLHGFYNLCMELDGWLLPGALVCLLFLVVRAYYVWGQTPSEEI